MFVSCLRNIPYRNQPTRACSIGIIESAERFPNGRCHYNIWNLYVRRAHNNNANVFQSQCHTTQRQRCSCATGRICCVFEVVTSTIYYSIRIESRSLYGLCRLTHFDSVSSDRAQLSSILIAFTERFVNAVLLRKGLGQQHWISYHCAHSWIRAFSYGDRSVLISNPTFRRRPSAYYQTLARSSNVLS